MPLVKMSKLLQRAEEKDIGCGAFNVGNMEMVRGVIRAAEELRTPVIMQIAESRLPHSPLSLMGPMMVSAAANASVDVAVHFDHGTSKERIKQALEYGFTSVMFDGSALPFAENVEKTVEIAELAAIYDADIEGELGVVGGSEGGGENAAIRCTDPADAKLYCVQTGINALAVAIGNAHGFYQAAPKLAFHALEEIRSRVSAPLVLHGGSGINAKDFQRAIRCGIRKVNIATANFHALAEGAAAYIDTMREPDYFQLSQRMTESVCETVKKHILVFNMEE